MTHYFGFIWKYEFIVESHITYIGIRFIEIGFSGELSQYCLLSTNRCFPWNILDISKSNSAILKFMGNLSAYLCFSYKPWLDFIKVELSFLLQLKSPSYMYTGLLAKTQLKPRNFRNFCIKYVCHNLRNNAITKRDQN